MATPCPVCNQPNPDGALYCGFCKTAFRRASPSPPRAATSGPPLARPSTAPAPRAAPGAGLATPSAGGAPASPSRGLSYPLVGLVALASAALGFVGRGLVGQSGPPPERVAEAPANLPAAAPPRAEPPAAPAPKPAAQVAAAPAVAPAPAATDAAPSPPQPMAQPAAPAPAPSVATVASNEPPAPVLRQVSVPYKPYEGRADRIIIPVRLNNRVTADMALDTGAPSTVIFAPLAERLGLLDKGSSRLWTTVGGIGGQAPALLVIVDSLSVDEARTEFVPATVTDEMTDAFEGLVGMDFLAGYAVQIDTQRHRLVLTEQPASSARPAGHGEEWWRRTFALLDGQEARWRQFHATIRDRASRSMISSEKSSELLAFAERQAREAETLASRLERYASNNSVPREWRRE